MRRSGRGHDDDKELRHARASEPVAGGLQPEDKAPAEGAGGAECRDEPQDGLPQGRGGYAAMRAVTGMYGSIRHSISLSTLGIYC